MSHSLFDIEAVLPLVQSGYTLLTPNIRLARRGRQAWDSFRVAAGDSVWEPLQIHPLEHWLVARWRHAVCRGRVSPRALLSPAQELQLWQRVIEHCTETAGDFSLLHPSSAAELARAARDSLLRWRLDADSAAVRQLFAVEDDCATFLSWLEAFEHDIADRDQFTPADCIAALADSGPDPDPDALPVALVECGDLSPLVRECLDGQTTALKTVVHEGRAATPQVHPFADRRGELQEIAIWAADLHRRAPATTIGIVMAGTGTDRIALEYLLRREFDCLGADYHSLPVNFSTGISLAAAPVVRDALAVLALALDRVAVPDVTALLRSRFVQLPDADSPLAQYFTGELYGGASEWIDVASLRHFASNVRLGDQQGLALGAHLMAVAGMRELRGRAAPSEWIERFNGILAEWGWPGGEPLDSLEFQQVDLWYRTLDEYRALDAVCSPVDIAEALRMLREACDSQISQPKTADTAVQVLGPLEAAGLSFDHLWLSGMQAGTWPSPPRPNPFIPTALQAAHDMPHATAEREWEYAGSLLAQYRRTSGALHASYSRQSAGAPDLPSPLLEGFDLVEPPVPPAVPANWSAALAGGGLNVTDDSVAPAPDTKELDTLRGGAALLEDQSQCPFRAFARRRLRAEPLGEFAAGITPAERGQIVHEALQALWTSIGDHQALVALEGAVLDGAVQRAAEVGMAALADFRRRAVGSACLELESDRLRGLLREWLDVESDRGAFAVAAQEQRVEVTLEQLRLSLRVDRIDTLEDGSQIIIDYKTGSASIADWLGDRPPRPQLLLYGLAASQVPAALAFAQVRPGECRYVGLGEVESIPGVQADIAAAVKDKTAAADWAALNEEWRHNLQRLARDFVGGAAQVDPLRGACTWCGLQALCRVDAADVVEQDE